MLRVDSRQEPGAGIQHAGICAGDGPTPCVLRTVPTVTAETVTEMGMETVTEMGMRVALIHFQEPGPSMAKRPRAPQTRAVLACRVSPNLARTSARIRVS